MRNTGLLYDLSYLEKRAKQLKPNFIEIYYDQITPGPTKQYAKAQTIRPINKEPYSFGEQFEFFKNNTFGVFTAVFKPSLDVIYFQNDIEDQHQLNGQELPNSNGRFLTKSLIDEAVQKELKIAQLEKRVKELETELEEVHSLEHKFQATAIGVISHFFGGGEIFKPQAPLNGAQQQQYMASEEQTDFTQIPVNDLEQALTVIILAFGDDWVMRFAKQLQQQPDKVAMIKNFIP